MQDPFVHWQNIIPRGLHQDRRGKRFSKCGHLIYIGELGPDPDLNLERQYNGHMHAAWYSRLLLVFYGPGAWISAHLIRCSDMHSSGYLSQSVLQRKRSQESHPIGGSSALPLSRATTVLKNTTWNIRPWIAKPIPGVYCGRLIGINASNSYLQTDTPAWFEPRGISGHN